MINIHTEVYGQGQPLVMIHGWSMHTGVWRQFAQDLAKNFQVICVDLPGHGRSQSIEPYELEQISEALMQAIPVQTFFVLGWSLGATVAMDMVGRFPNRAEGLVVLAGNPCFVKTDGWPGTMPEVLQVFADQLTYNCQVTLMRFLALQVMGLDNGKDLLKRLNLAVLECEPPLVSVLQGGLDILKSNDLTNVLKNTQCPLAFILGDKDTLIPKDVGEKLQQLNPQADIHVLENAGHVPFLSHQRQIVEIINNFAA